MFALHWDPIWWLPKAEHSGGSGLKRSSLATAAEPHERGSLREVQEWFAVGSEQGDGVEGGNKA